MFRAPLIAVLTLLVALPHGVCFCDFLHAAPPRSESCCESQSPQAPVDPTDDADDHERDCPCKLREVLAGNPAPATVAVDGVSFGLMSDAFHASTFFAPTADVSRSASFMPFDDARPLILRALRI